MKVDTYGQTIVTADELFKAIYSGKLTNFNDIILDDASLVAQFNKSVTQNADPIGKLSVHSEPTDSVEFFDEANQCDWFMPDDYYPNLVEMLYGMCETQEQTDRVNLEITLYIQHGVFDVLFYLKYLVDTMRENNIVWGVGRGSSVASYVLYLIGVHKIDSIKYELDINEFLK